MHSTHCMAEEGKRQHVLQNMQFSKAASIHCSLFLEQHEETQVKTQTEITTIQKNCFQFAIKIKNYCNNVIMKYRGSIFFIHLRIIQICNTR
eukprot:c55886_g1_i1 orf=103-378(+)